MNAWSLGKTLLGVGVLIALDLNATVPAAAQTTDGGLPPKAEVIYRGTTDARLGEPARVSVRVPRRLTLRGVVGSVSVPDSRRTSFAVTLRMRFDGAAVTARVYGTGALRPDSLSGAVENGVCRLSNDVGTSVWEGQCDARGFSGTFKSHATGGLVLEGRFETTAERVSDLAAVQPPAPPPSQTQQPQGAATAPSGSATTWEAPAWWRNRGGGSEWPIAFADDSGVYTFDARRARRAGANQILLSTRIDLRIPERLRNRTFDGLIYRKYIDCAAMREMMTDSWFVRGNTVVDSVALDSLKWTARPGSPILSRICRELQGGVALQPVDPADRTPEAGRRRTTATAAAAGVNLDTTRLTGVPVSGKTTFQLTASMSNIDDIGQVFVLSDQGGGPVLICAWSGGVPGQGSVALDSHLNVGKNLVLFSLYDRRVVGFASMLTPGRWGYRFQLSDHAGPLWSASGAGMTDVEGFRYVYAVYIRREPSGTIRVMPRLTAADRADIRELILPRLARVIEEIGLSTTDLSSRSSC